ncbi:hypothetical protein [Clostridium sp. CF012]|uniref:hypothetical protein n=1 Tax=Clostridium sp. CF012 TaxID=2843319 RepID=UPI001C0B9953|nr:hypothetical protein [Clostridium sp. CF012]MBU3142561.1 hypothetical protein [Clostridium sp. CF012]
MKKNDLIWLGALLIIVFLLAFPSTNEIYTVANKAHPYIMGFIKVSILATMGELLALRISTGNYKKPVGVIYKFIVWGFLGMGFVIAFDLFANGVIGSMKKGLLPSGVPDTFSAKLLFAFFTSAFMNLIFGPTFMTLHRLTDTYIDLGHGEFSEIRKVKLRAVTNKIDWYGFMSFVVFKTIPFFWIPAHTITFLLPGEYRVLMAAFLSLALGVILAYSKRKNLRIA